MNGECCLSFRLVSFLVITMKYCKSSNLLPGVVLILLSHLVVGLSLVKRAGNEAGGFVSTGTHMAAGRRSQCRGGFDVYFLLDR